MVIVITKKGFVMKYEESKEMPEAIPLVTNDEVVSALYVDDITEFPN